MATAAAAPDKAAAWELFATNDCVGAGAGTAEVAAAEEDTLAVAVPSLRHEATPWISASWHFNSWMRAVRLRITLAIEGGEIFAEIHIIKRDNGGWMGATTC